MRGILKAENRLRNLVLALSACMAVRLSQKTRVPLEETGPGGRDGENQTTVICPLI